MNLSMDIYLLYAFVGVSCAITISIILYRVLTTIYRESLDNKFLSILVFFIIFCLIDTVWGIIGSKSLFTDGILVNKYLISTYAFHIFAMIASFMISYYGMYYLELKGKLRTCFNVWRILLLIAQCFLLIQNTKTGNFFVILEDGTYVSNKLRSLSFYLQFGHYIPLIIYSLVMWIKNKFQHKAYFIYHSGFFFLTIPLVFGLLQKWYPDGSFYSIGFMIISVAIYAINVTKQREDYLKKYLSVVEQEKSRKQIEDALAIAKKANAAKSKFLANMSHDIRTPINGILGMVYIAKKEEASPKIMECLENIDNSSQHLLSLINDVLDMSAIESGQSEIVHKNAINLKTIIDNCSSIVKGQIGTKGLVYECNMNNCNHFELMGDSLRLRQILVNILSNAIKFTPEGGKITFSIDELSFKNDTATYQFAVTDAGIGMKPEFMKKLFEPFQQESNDSRGIYKGTGLGMAIAKQLTELMGGKIEVNSTVGVGSTFTVTIPFEINKDESYIDEASKIEEIPDNYFEGKKILLVEDNELNLEIAKTILEGAKFDVHVAHDGEEAYEEFKKSEVGFFDVILMDVMMPVLDGYGATKKIRELSRTDAHSVPIIATTANAFEEDKRKAYEAGMNGHVSKPIDYKLLFNEIAKWIK